MRKIFAMVLLCSIVTATSYAQTQKGNQLVGLGLGYSTNKSDYSFLNTSTGEWGSTINRKITSFNLGLMYSYFIADKLDIAGGVSYGNSKTDNNTVGNVYFNNTQKSRFFSASAEVRKYFLFEDKIGIRTGPYFNYRITENDNDDRSDLSDFRDHSKGFSTGVGVDFVYFPSKRIALAARVGDVSYSHYKSSETVRQTSSAFNASFFNTLGLSVYYVIGTKN